MGGLDRTPPTKEGIITQAEEGEEMPKMPRNEHYTKEEIGQMNQAERQWLRCHEFLIDWVETDPGWLHHYSVGSTLDDSSELAKNLTGTFQQMALDSEVKIGEDVKPIFERAQEIPALHYEKDVGKILKGWPDEDCPKFWGTVNDDANDWLGTMAVLLTDRQAHLSLWHVAAGQRLSGKAFKDH